MEHTSDGGQSSLAFIVQASLIFTFQHMAALLGSLFSQHAAQTQDYGRERTDTDTSITFDGATGSFWRGGRHVTLTPGSNQQAVVRDRAASGTEVTINPSNYSTAPTAVVASTDVWAATGPVGSMSMPSTSKTAYPPRATSPRVLVATATSLRPAVSSPRLTASSRLTSSPNYASPVEARGLTRSSPPMRFISLGPNASARFVGGRAYQHVPTRIVSLQPQEVGLLTVHKTPSVVPSDHRFNPMVSPRRGSVLTQNLVQSYSAYTSHLEL